MARLCDNLACVFDTIVSDSHGHHHANTKRDSCYIAAMSLDIKDSGMSLPNIFASARDGSYINMFVVVHRYANELPL